MVDAGPAAGQESTDRRIWRSCFEKLEAAPPVRTNREKGDAHSLFLDRLHSGEVESEGVSPEAKRFFDRFDGDAEVAQLMDVIGFHISSASGNGLP